jgi:hypothetical protein
MLVSDGEATNATNNELSAVPPALAPAVPAPASLKDRASTALSELLDRLSQPVPVAMTYVNTIYPDQVMYFGKYTNKNEVMENSLKYMQRWPERKYEVIQDSINCDATELTCLINGQMKWLARSAARNIEAAGVAEFSYKFGFRNGTPLLLLQSSRVISRSSRSINASIGASSPGAAVSTAAPLVLPRVISPKYASEDPSQSRMHTCLEQYIAEA